MVIVVGSLLVGGAGTSLHESFAALLSHDESLAATIVYELRLPRTLAAFGTGGLLALSGGLMQVLLRNPLADPYILGLSGGAATGHLVLRPWGKENRLRVWSKWKSISRRSRNYRVGVLLDPMVALLEYVRSTLSADYAISLIFD